MHLKPLLVPRRNRLLLLLAALVGLGLFGVAYQLRPHNRLRQRNVPEEPTPNVVGGRLPDDTYLNPVGGNINLGDPYVLFDRGRYHLYGTRTRDGFRDYVSDDLVSWKDGQYYYDVERHPYCTRSFWAPEVHAYGGSFYLVFSCEHRGGLIFASKPIYRLALARAERPDGPFRDVRVPWFDSFGDVIDPNLFIDEDQRAYLYFAQVGRENGYIFAKIFGVELEPNLLTTKSAPKLLLQATPGWEISDPKNRTNEGPFVFRRGRYYYLLYSGNHFANPNYAVGYARSTSPLGPWERNPHNPVLAMKPSLGVTAVGHASVARSPDGSEWFMVYHAHDEQTSNRTVRRVYVDRMLFDEQGQFSVTGPTRTPQRLPSGAK